MIWAGFTSSDDVLLAIVIFVSFFRGITYFRVNSKTRYLINLIFQVCIDVVTFFIVFIYAIIGLFIAFYTVLSGELDKNTEKDSFKPTIDLFDVFTNSAMISLGSWDPSFFHENLSALILFLATMINPIIMLNLVVSILSDTFEKVQLDQEIFDRKELVEMIFEVETLMF